MKKRLLKSLPFLKFLNKEHSFLIYFCSKRKTKNKTKKDEESESSKTTSTTSGSNKLGKNIFLKNTNRGSGETTTSNTSESPLPADEKEKYDDDFYSSLDSSSSNHQLWAPSPPRRSPRRNISTDFFNFDDFDRDDDDDEPRSKSRNDSSTSFSQDPTLSAR